MTGGLGAGPSRMDVTTKRQWDLKGLPAEAQHEHGPSVGHVWATEMRLAGCEGGRNRRAKMETVGTVVSTLDVVQAF